MFGNNNNAGSFLGETGTKSYLSQVPDILKQYYAPYGRMVHDPASVMQQLGGGFQESPGYQFGLNQAEGAIGRAATAGGMSGSPMQQVEAGKAATGLANQDYYNYLNHALNIYMGGVHGYSELGENLSSNLMSQSQLKQQQEEQEAKEEGSMFTDFGAGLGAIL